MAEIEVEGKTVEDAINDGLAKLGCSRDMVEIKILNEGTSGLFGLMGTKPARVLITTRETVAKSAVDFVAAQQQVKEAIGNILKLMNITAEEITAAAVEDHITAEIKTPESSLVIGKNGQTLEALEHIVNLIVNKNEKTRVKVDLDTEKYRQRQEEKLVTMATKAAEQATRSGRIYRFDPMSAKERRLIHMALKDNPDVETFSEGEGAFRKVGVKPIIRK